MIMTKSDFLKTYKEVMGVELTWTGMLYGLVAFAVFLVFCALGELF